MARIAADCSMMGGSIVIDRPASGGTEIRASVPVTPEQNPAPHV